MEVKVDDNYLYLPASCKQGIFINRPPSSVLIGTVSSQNRPFIKNRFSIKSIHRITRLKTQFRTILSVIPFRLIQTTYKIKKRASIDNHINANSLKIFFKKVWGHNLRADHQYILDGCDRGSKRRCQYDERFHELEQQLVSYAFQ